MLGHEAKPFEVKLDTGADGQAIWVCRDLQNIKEQRAAELFAAKMSVRDVADELDISKSAAQRLRAKWKASQSEGASQGPIPIDAGRRDSERL